MAAETKTKNDENGVKIWVNEIQRSFSCLFKLIEVANVIDPLVEPSGKLRRNRLHAHAFASQCPENEKQVER